MLGELKVKSHGKLCIYLLDVGVRGQKSRQTLHLFNVEILMLLATLAAISVTLLIAIALMKPLLIQTNGGDINVSLEIRIGRK